MSALAILHSLLSNSVVDPVFGTIRGIARVIEKLAFFLAGWTLIRRSISLQCVSTFSTFPTVHKNHLLGITENLKFKSYEAVSKCEIYFGESVAGPRTLFDNSRSIMKRPLFAPSTNFSCWTT